MKVGVSNEIFIHPFVVVPVINRVMRHRHMRCKCVLVVDKGHI